MKTLRKLLNLDTEINSPMLLSAKERKLRIDIALLLTWRSIAKLKNSVDTNLLILDEIFDGSLDQQGGSDLGWILRNFDDNTNVFVISHKEQMVDKYDRTLNVEKVKNFSVVRETIADE